MSTQTSSPAIEKLKARLYDVNALREACNIMEWDQQVNMPRGGALARAEHLGILSRMTHETFTSDETIRLAEAAAKDAEPGSDDAAVVRVVKRDLDLATKIPASLVEEKSKAAAEGHEKWVVARQNNDFKAFLPCLEHMFSIARQEAEFLGYKDHIYDALLDQYEEGATAADVRAMFGAVKDRQVDLVRRIQASGNQPDDSRLYGDWPEDKQKAFTENLVQKIGFSFERGRQDTAPHPFCTSFSVGDVRLTTRWKPYVGSAIFGSLHEAGHGMYEQGQNPAWDRSPLCGGVSLGLHESQSRTWENIVGRSKAFWKRFLPDLQTTFPQLSDIGVDDWYRMINKVSPSFIRVEADEVTYNLHILARFEIECDVLTGALPIRDLPEAWNAKYKQYLGVTPETDTVGCLQDVHWSGGMIGYFPTYSMGNLLSYQIWNVLEKDLGDTSALMEKGEFAPILGWLQEKIYRQGKYYSPKELVMRVTGKPMGAEDYVTGLTKKYEEIYGL
ncbi:MAG: carboxypeptidase M32 [Armatimonadetes bacterium]|nr:carboxypeptidase M32 [Armatimonadota bacterium]